MHEYLPDAPTAHNGHARILGKGCIFPHRSSGEEYAIPSIAELSTLKKGRPGLHARRRCSNAGTARFCRIGSRSDKGGKRSFFESRRSPRDDRFETGLFLASDRGIDRHHRGADGAQRIEALSRLAPS